MGFFDRLMKRNVPASSSQAFQVWLSENIAIQGYRRLQDCPEIVAAVNVYADLISSMTIHLMENRKGGDVRIKNALSRLIDIEPNPVMTKRQFYAHIVRVLLLYGDGNAVVFPIIKKGLIEQLVPLESSKVRFEDDKKLGHYKVIYGENQVYGPDEVLHFRVNPDPS